MLNKNSNISVDIILPNYNSDDFFEETIDSIINQTFKNWNLIIIDDNSNIKNQEMIKKYSNHYWRGGGRRSGPGSASPTAKRHAHEFSIPLRVVLRGELFLRSCPLFSNFPGELLLAGRYSVRRVRPRAGPGSVFLSDQWPLLIGGIDEFGRSWTVTFHSQV